jgi:rhamnosyl/mannosyltransferase
MKVLQIAKFNPSNYFGGIETVVKTFTHAHRDNGDEITSLVKGGESHEDYVAISDSFFFIKRFIWLFFNLKRFDLIYIHIPNIFCLLPVLLLNLGRRKLICVYHSDVRKFSVVGELYQGLTHYLLEFVDAIYCSSNEFLNSSRTLSYYKNKCEVIPFTFKEVIGDKSDSDDYILLIARDTHYKGIDFAIDALKDSEFKIKVIGCDREDKNNIKFYSNVSEQRKWELISGCKFLLMASTRASESYGLVIVEAFSRGKCVLAPGLGTGVNYLVGDNERGVLFETLNKKSLLESMELLSGDINLRAKKERAVVDFYTKFLTYESFQNNLIKLHRNNLSI